MKTKRIGCPQLAQIAEKHGIELVEADGNESSKEITNFRATTTNKVFGEMILSIGVGSFHYSGIGRGMDHDTVEIAVISEKIEHLMNVGGSDRSVLPYVSVDMIPPLFEFIQTMETEDELVAFCEEFTQTNN